jgi:hypothetical protein
MLCNAAQGLEERKQTASGIGRDISCRPMAGDVFASQSCEVELARQSKKKPMAFDDAYRFNPNLIS